MWVVCIHPNLDYSYKFGGIIKSNVLAKMIFGLVNTSQYQSTTDALLGGRYAKNRLSDVPHYLPNHP